MIANGGSPTSVIIAADDAEIGKAFHEQADIHRRLGRLDRAETLYLEARGRALDTAETRLAAMAAASLSVIAMVRGDHDKALRHQRASLAEYRALGVPKEVLDSLRGMGQLCVELERWEDSARAFDEAEQIAEVPETSPSVFGFSRIARAGDRPRGFRLGGGDVRDGAISVRTITRVRCAG